MTTAEAEEWIMEAAAQLLMSPQRDVLTVLDAVRLAASRFKATHGVYPWDAPPKGLLAAALER